METDDRLGRAVVGIVSGIAVAAVIAFVACNYVPSLYEEVVAMISSIVSAIVLGFELLLTAIIVWGIGVVIIGALILIVAGVAGYLISLAPNP